MTKDEQAWANGYLEHHEYPNGNVDIMPSSPIEMKSVGEIKTIPSPDVGAHTGQVLAELGYTAEQIEAMLAAGAAHGRKWWCDYGKVNWQVRSRNRRR